MQFLNAYAVVNAGCRNSIYEKMTFESCIICVITGCFAGNCAWTKTEIASDDKKISGAIGILHKYAHSDGRIVFKPEKMCPPDLVFAPTLAGRSVRS